MEAKRKSLLEGSSENSLIASLQDQLAELETRKRRPYGTVHAVRIVYISFSCSSHAAVFFFRPFWLCSLHAGESQNTTKKWG